MYSVIGKVVAISLVTLPLISCSWINISTLTEPFNPLFSAYSIYFSPGMIIEIRNRTSHKGNLTCPSMWNSSEFNLLFFYSKLKLRNDPVCDLRPLTLIGLQRLTPSSEKGFPQMRTNKLLPGLFTFGFTLLMFSHKPKLSRLLVKLHLIYKVFIKVLIIVWLTLCPLFPLRF